jgi:hypothetical protein
LPRVTRLLRRAFVLLIASASVATAQSASYRPPRTADGRPDLQGIWQVMNAAAWDIQDHNASHGIPAGRGVVDGNDIPYQPWALKQKQENYANREKRDPVRQCLLPGVPRITYMPHPFQIVYSGDTVNVLYEYGHALRHIYMNGNAHPQGPIEWWMGDSRGRWDGDTLVVDAVHFGPETWFDAAGNFHSDQLHVVERYTRIDADHMRYEATIEDAKVFTRPWKMAMTLYRRVEPDAELLEYECYAYLLEETWPNK